MKKTLIIMLALLAALGAMSCKKEKDKLPDGTDKVSEYATIPSFRSLFLALDKVETGDLTILKPSGYSVAGQDTLRAAFMWGTLGAEAQLAVSSQNTGWLNSVLEQLKTLAPVLGLKDMAVQVEQGIKPLLAAGDWDKVKQALYEMQSNVDVLLISQKLYSEYTIMGLGSWTESVNQIGKLIAKSYSIEKSRVLVTTAWQDLSDNLLLIESQKIVSTVEFPKAFGKVQELRDMMNTAGPNPLAPEQISAIVTATESIRASFMGQTP